MKVTKKPERKASLTNDGILSIFAIGTGAAFTKTLNDNNILVVKGNDHLLIDCGTTCTKALYEKGIQVLDIKNLLITHSHADHIGGLEEIMMKGRYIGKTKPNIVINEEYQKILWDQSLSGGSRMAESKQLEFKDFWNVIRPKKMENMPRETWEVNLGNLNVKLPRTMHVPDDSKSWQDSHWSCGVILDDRVLFTSDTKFDPDLLESFDSRFNFEYIFHDCQLFTAGVHASIQELSTLPGRLKAKIILMHYGDDWEDFKQQATEAGFHSWAKEGHTYSFPDQV